MIVYSSNKKEFMDHVENDYIACAIDEFYRDKIGKSNYKEFKSWDNSMQYLYKVLNTNEISDDCTIAIEYRIPASAKRIDFLISGLDENDKENVVIVELKQWENVEKVKDEDGLVKTFLGNSKRKTVHPSYQAWTYAALIEDYNESAQEGKIILHPCAYLHNYIKVHEDDPILDDEYKDYLEKAPVYRKGEAMKLREFISKFVKKGDNGTALYEIENGKIRPSKSLQDALVLMLDGNEEFKMIDDQKVVYEDIKRNSKKYMLNDKKLVYIIEGGPGTGKTVLAINLLVKLLNENLVVCYATKNAAPREVYEKKLKGRYKNKDIRNLFKGSGSFTKLNSNELDVILADESHRLIKKSRYDKKGENQIKEIINSSKVSVFFIDEKQRVSIDDIGSVSEIEEHANYYGAKIKKLKLTSQFRCNGSDSYLNWIDDVLEIDETGNFDGFEFDYDIEIKDSPKEIYEIIKEKNKINNKSRMLAGYCWEWKSKKDLSVYDIEIEDFKMKWNLSSSKTWAIDENSVNQVGCIHTSQGLEFDYIGLIIGKDLRYENGRIVTDFTKRAKGDKTINGIKKMYKENPEKALKIADEIIKNTYKTLMTRGMKGCYIYCEDKNLSKYLKDRIEKVSEFVENKDIEVLAHA
ncbi:DNA/RNA helicase domain-containing protein [Clostridium thermobutyricum]